MIVVPDDAELAARAIAGERAAFVALYRRHSNAVAKLARTYGAAPAELDDIVQEVFLSAWRHLADYDRQRPFKSWLLKIALNRVRDAYRRRRVRDFFFGAMSLEAGVVEIEAPVASPETIAHDRVALARVAHAIERLPGDLRAALLLTAVTGLSYQEAAESLSVSVKTLEGRIARARQRLNAGLPERLEKIAAPREGGPKTPRSKS